MVDVLAQNGVALEEAQVAQAAAEGRAKALQLEVEAMAEAEAGIVSREQALEHGMTAQKARLQEQVEAREAAEEAAAALRVELAQQRISFEQELRTVRTELVQARTEVATLKSPSPSSNAAADNVRSHATCVVVSPKLTHRLSMKQDDKAWQSKCSQAELQVKQLKVMVRTAHSRARDTFITLLWFEQLATSQERLASAQATPESGRSTTASPGAVSHALLNKSLAAVVGENAVLQEELDYSRSQLAAMEGKVDDLQAALLHAEARATASAANAAAATRAKESAEAAAAAASEAAAAATVTDPSARQGASGGGGTTTDATVQRQLHALQAENEELGTLVLQADDTMQKLETKWRAKLDKQQLDSGAAVTRLTARLRELEAQLESARASTARTPATSPARVAPPVSAPDTPPANTGTPSQARVVGEVAAVIRPEKPASQPSIPSAPHATSGETAPVMATPAHEINGDGGVEPRGPASAAGPVLHPGLNMLAGSRQVETVIPRAASDSAGRADTTGGHDAHSEGHATPPADAADVQPVGVAPSLHIPGMPELSQSQMDTMVTKALLDVSAAVEDPPPRPSNAGQGVTRSKPATPPSTRGDAISTRQQEDAATSELKAKAEELQAMADVGVAPCDLASMQYFLTTISPFANDCGPIVELGCVMVSECGRRCLHELRSHTRQRPSSRAPTGPTR